MGAIWFWIVAVMLVAYVVLDGFDIGVGILYPILARTEEDRSVMLRSIGPVWDGNEVWLLAGGGTLYFAFPLLYASAFSGFYLPLMIVLWLLIGRGASIELRSLVDSSVWRSFFDGVFSLSSSLLAIFLGAALANVIRGVPIGPDNYFFLPLWTNWRVGPQPGILDWYTVIGGLVAFIALAVHGALYLAMKASGELEQRARRFSEQSWFALCAITAVSLVATMLVRPATLQHYNLHPLAYAVPVLVVLSLAGMKVFSARGDEFRAFLSSCLFLAVMLAGAAIGLYPTLLPSSTDAACDITVAKALTGAYATHVGLVWWSFGILLALGYHWVSYGMFRGKVSAQSDGYGH
jgi:cytochrome d ubiquinol oxidase subunit II